MGRFCCSVVLGLGLVWGATAVASEWTPEDILLAEHVGEIALSPSGDAVAYTIVQMDEDEGKRVSNLYLYRFESEETIPLTRGTDRVQGVHWSPSGHRIAFLWTRDLPDGASEGEPADSQLWLIRPDGGEAWHASAFERGMKSYGWRDDERIVYAAEEAPDRAEQERDEQDDTSKPVEDPKETPPVRLFELAVDDGETRRITTNDDWIEWVSVSPDGRWAVTSNQKSLSYEFDEKVHPESYLYDLETGLGRQIFDGTDVEPYFAVWSPDGAGFYVGDRYSTHPTYTTAAIREVYYYDVDDANHVKVDLDWMPGNGFSEVVATNDGFVTIVPEGVYMRAAKYTKRGNRWSRTMLRGEAERHIFGLDVTPDGRRIVYNHSKADMPGQLYVARLRGGRITGAEAITELNSGYAKKAMPETEIVRFTGAEGDEVEGILYYPIGYEAGKRYPLILAIHGGPAGADVDQWAQSWAYPTVMFNQKGALVLKVNYHGSSNYGLDWLESIGGRYYELEVPDLEAGVDAMIARGLADPERLATMGWSNGSILSIALSVSNPRYKAVSAGAGDVEWFSDWGNVDFGATFDNYYLGATPWEDPARYMEKSPFFKLDRVTAPTIIYFGTEDRAVPPSQGWSHFRALQQFGNTDVRFVLFPGEPHGLNKYAHQKRKLTEDLAWFDRHFFGNEAEPNPAVKKGSPLERALSVSKAARVGERLGVEANGVLAPETVTYKEVTIGRFEVTRAQYAAFDSTYAVAAGSEDFPASGISFEQAKAYAAWLSEQTGIAFAIGSKDAVQSLYEGAEAKENTLDHWAGYAVNPDDAIRLTEAAAALGHGALLVEVGSFPAKGGEDVAVFDLGGNVAEWAVGADGAGVLLGGSADMPADGVTRTKDAAPAYRGLRIVVTDDME